MLPTPARERASYLSYRQAAEAAGGTVSALAGPAGGSATRQCHDTAQKKAVGLDLVPVNCDRQDPAAVRTAKSGRRWTDPRHRHRHTWASGDRHHPMSWPDMRQHSCCRGRADRLPPRPPQLWPRLTRALIERGRGSFYFGAQWRPPALLTGLRAPLCRGMTAHVLPSTKGRGLGKSGP